MSKCFQPFSWETDVGIEPTMRISRYGFAGRSRTMRAIRLSTQSSGLGTPYRSTSYFSDCCLKCNFRIQSAILHCRCPSMPSVARCCFFGQFRPTRAPAACDFLFSLSFSFRVPCNRKAPRILSFSWRILGAFRVPKTRTGSSSLRTPRSFRSMSFYLTFTIAEPPWRLARRNRVPA